MTTADTLARTARLTGLAYLGIIIAGIFGQFVARESLLVVDDPIATSANIAGSLPLFRAGIAADLVMISLDVGVAVGLYVLLRAWSQPLALLAAALRLVQAAVLGANLINLAQVLQLATGGPALGGIPAPSRAAQVLAALDTHALVYDLGLVFFGLACLVLARLLRTSGLVPAPYAVGIGVAGGVYLVGSFAALLAPSLGPTIDPFYGLTVAAEVGLAGHLAFRGVPTARRPRTHPIAVAT